MVVITHVHELWRLYLLYLLQFYLVFKGLLKRKKFKYFNNEAHPFALFCVSVQINTSLGASIIRNSFVITV